MATIVPDVSMVLLPDGTIQSILALSSLFNFRSEQMVGASVLDYIKKDQESFFLRFLDQKKEACEMGRFDFKVASNDWQSFDLTFCFSGQQIAVVGRRSVDQDFLRLKSAIDGSFDSIFMLQALKDSQGKVQDFIYVDINAKAEEFVGRPKAEMIGKRIKEHFPWMIQTGIINELQSVVEQNKPTERIFQFTPPGGATVWLHHQVIPVADGVCSTVRDITKERELAESARRQQEILLETQRLTNMASYEVCTLTHSKEWSANAPSLYGLPHGTTMEQVDFESLIHPEDQKANKLIWAQAVQDGKSFSMIYRICKSDGAQAWMVGVGHCIRDGSGGVVRIHGCIQDITERKLRDEALEEQRRRAIQSSKMASLGEMAAGFAHEINNPVSVIVARSSLLHAEARRGNIDPQRVMDACSQIKDTGLKVSKIISGLRSFARSGGRDPLISESLNEILAEVEQICSEKFKMADVKLSVHYPKEEAMVSCRKGQLIQVLFNLLSNAFEAARVLESRWVEVFVKQESDMWVIAVQDSGKITSEYVISRLMQPFFTTKEVGVGVGLGLSISKGLIHAQGGLLAYRGDLPNTQFEVSLPVGSGEIVKKVPVPNSDHNDRGHREHIHDLGVYLD